MGLAGYATRGTGNASAFRSEFTRAPGSAVVTNTRFVRPTDGSLSAGYRELFKNKTLAGRKAHQHFTNQPQPPVSTSRIQMVSRLRKKEKYMIWRHILDDMFRYIFSGFHRYSPLRLVYTDIRDITSSAIRRPRI